MVVVLVLGALLALTAVVAANRYVRRRPFRDTTAGPGRARRAAAADPTVAGVERYDDTQLYVSRRAAAWGPPTRAGAPSDITVVQPASRQA